MEITAQEEIIWHMWRPAPGEFNCNVCEKNEATMAVKIDTGKRPIKIIICLDCLKKGVEWIAQAMYNALKA